jgi:hypothetical protein
LPVWSQTWENCPQDIYSCNTEKKTSKFMFLHVVDQQRTMLYEGHVIYCT